MPRFSLLALLLLFTASPAFAQAPKSLADVAELKAEIVPDKAKRGQTVTYRFTATPRGGGWVYPITPSIPGQLSKTALVPPRTGNLIFVTPATDPPDFKWKQKLTDNELHEVSTLPVTWEMKAVVSPNAATGDTTVKLDKETSFPACNDFGCTNILFDGSDLPVAKFKVLEGDPVPVESQYKDAVVKAVGPAAPVNPPAPSDLNRDKPDVLGPPARAGATKNAKPIEQVQTELKAIFDNLDKTEVPDTTKTQGIGAFVLTAVIWGLVSLVTPCVFPMIPITVSIFLKHAHGSFRERMKLAAVYCLTIIVVLGLSAFALLKFMAALSVNPITNVLLGGLFVVLALSLFGMYELTLPNFMVKRLQAKQSQGGVIGTIFGALAFTVISFTCVAPFLGGFAGISAADASGGSLIGVPTTREIVGGLAFATAFAAPFFVLALIPGLLKSLPKSGGWLDSVKVVMGFLELAAALKFFRTAELGVFSPTEYFTFDLVLAGWVGISFACGLYLLNAYRLPHDEEKPNIGVPRLLFALAFLGLGVYLLPAVFKIAEGKGQRPAGAVYAWVDAFLLPEPNRESDLRWSTDLHDSIAKVRAEAKGGTAKPIIVDFTGVTCTNCKYNETSVFPQPAIRELLTKFERTQLYTDWVPAEVYVADPGDRARRAEANANRKFKIDTFGTDQLPLYAILWPTANGKVKVLGVYDEGKINQPDRFANWLKEGLEKAKR